MITNEGSELEEKISPMIILEKINAIEARIENHFSQVWFTLVTESESESESQVQGALRSSVNQKEESEVESEARRNRSQKDQKSFLFFRFRFCLRRFRRADSH